MTSAPAIHVERIKEGSREHEYRFSPPTQPLPLSPRAASSSQQLAAITVDPFMGSVLAIHVKRIKEGSREQEEESVLHITGPQGRIMRCVWGPLNQTLIGAGEDCIIRMWDAETGKLLRETEPEVAHSKTVTSLSKSADGSHFITGSLDKCAKLWDTRTLRLLKTYQTERPINAADISPLFDHVVLGGGQDAASVTTTSSRAGKFEAVFYHKVLEEEIGRVKGHFGPLNALAFGPDGRSFASGGEDGYVRLHHFDNDYFHIRV
ncbi:unnamed protein product [Closterium sp. NIES-54]